jgi:hypothetical protein
MGDRSVIYHDELPDRSGSPHFNPVKGFNRSCFAGYRQSKDVPEIAGGRGPGTYAYFASKVQWQIMEG